MAQVAIPHKLGLKASLQNLVLKRLQSSKQSIDFKNMWRKEEKKYELSQTEIERIKMRRIQNKMSAKRCREKSRKKVAILEQDLQKLMTENETLISEIERLKKAINESRTELLRTC